MLSEGLSTDTHLASGVPGTVDGMINAHSKYGKLPFKDVIQPAIDLAEKGFPITKRQATDLNSNRKTFIERNSFTTCICEGFTVEGGRSSDPEQLLLKH